MSIGPTRALPDWRLSPAREQQLHQRLERFVTNAIRYLTVRRS
jgi:hypothetical protein